ncbi:ABC transporter G family member STR2-like [Nicotiana tomentosiformis]|uniref:ABC transporter G family member STR2-like n=1 Tax=Nicotiana tomentosiformis TaxID=4098 RepID=UPI00388CCFFA
MRHVNGHHRVDTKIEIGMKPVNFTGGLEFSNLTYTLTKKIKDTDGKWLNQEVDLLHQITGYAPKGCVTAVMGPSGTGKSTFLDGLAGRILSLRGRVSVDGIDMTPSFIKRTSAYIMQDDRLFPMLTVYETLLFAADFRLGPISMTDKRQRVEKLIEQLGLPSARNTYIGDEGTRGVSGGERRRVSIGVDIIHGPSLLFLDEPTSGLDSTSAHSVIDKVHAIARAGSTVILTIHQPSSRIQLILDHLIILARGQLMYQGSPKDAAIHLGRMGRKVPKGESSIEYLIDVIQEYDQSELGVEALAAFALTGMKPPPLGEHEMSIVPSLPASSHRSNKRLNHLQTNAKKDQDFDHSLRSPWNSSKSWSASHSGVLQTLGFSPARHRTDHRNPNPISSSPGDYAYTSENYLSTTTPHTQSSECTLNVNDFLTPYAAANTNSYQYLGPKFANSFLSETWILMRRNFINI